MNQREDLEQALGELIRAIRESREYLRYQEIRTKVHADPALEQQIHEYRKTIYEFQNYTENQDLYEQADKMEREGAGFRENPLVREYLNAELAFCRLFQHINWSIVQNIDFDVGLVNE